MKDNEKRCAIRTSFLSLQILILAHTISKNKFRKRGEFIQGFLSCGLENIIIKLY